MKQRIKGYCKNLLSVGVHLIAVLLCSTNNHNGVKSIEGFQPLAHCESVLTFSTIWHQAHFQTRLLKEQEG